MMMKKKNVKWEDRYTVPELGTTSSLKTLKYVPTLEFLSATTGAGPLRPASKFAQ